MEKMTLSPIETEMANFNFDELNKLTQTAKANIAKAQSASDVKSQICNVGATLASILSMERSFHL
ncbi:MAG TPA: hypothetical protein VIJ75_07990 [Hanamia sp.]